MNVDTTTTYDAWLDAEAVDHAAEQRRAAQVAEAATAWRRAWPKHCAACSGWGGHGFTEMHGFSGGSGEPQFDPCQALPNPATCHRCGEDGLSEDADGPCARCGWDYDDGMPE